MDREIKYHRTHHKGGRAFLRFILITGAFTWAWYAAIRHGQASSVLAQEPSAATAPAADPITLECFSNHVSRPVDVELTGVYYHPGELDSVPPHLEGIAHFYGGGEPLNAFTSSGDLFDPRAMTAASWFYPLGSTVRVTDMTDGDTIHVVINDRGPNRVAYPDVIIDLTRGAMESLESGAGSLQVAVEPVCP